MIELKAHQQTAGKFSEIDKFAFIPKKFWDQLEVGDQELKMNGRSFKTRVYDMPCDCNGSMHSHRIVDLRSIWGDLELEDGDKLEISR